MENVTTENLKRATLRSLYLDGKFKGISKLNFNKSEYPFITLTREDKSATNLYFSKKAAEQIALNSFKEKTDLIANGFLTEAEVVQVENSNSEIRFKISIPSLESNYSSNSALEAAWGGQNNTAFDTELFSKEFTKFEVTRVEEQETA